MSLPIAHTLARLAQARRLYYEGIANCLAAYGKRAREATERVSIFLRAMPKRQRAKYRKGKFITFPVKFGRRQP